MGFMDMIFGFGFLAIIFGLIFAVIGVFLFIFWILMVVDCVKRKFKDDTEKIVWLLVLIFAGFIIGTLIYYFVVKIKDKKRRR
jgi:hypothetical protein